MRLHRDPEALSKLTATPFLITSFPFAPPQPLVVEVAMGKGEMITQLAKQQPKAFFVGIDREATVALKAARKAEALELTNFAIIVADASQIKTFFAKRITTLWLSFPDPWPKKRHAKRRLTHRAVLSQFAKVLDEGALLIFKSDNDVFFEWSLTEFAAAGFEITALTRDLHNSPLNATNVATEYETKWAARGKQINYLAARVKPKL